MAGNPSYDALLSTTLGNYRSEMADNVSLSFFLLYWLTTQGRKRLENGGESIIVQLLYGLNQTVRSFSGYEVLDTTPQEGITSIKIPWRQLAGTVSISGLEKRQNSGEQQIINLLAAKIKQAEISMSYAMNTQLFSDGLGNSSKDLFGLDLIVEDGTLWGSYGGINRADADNAWWRNQWAGGKATSAIDTELRSMYNKCSRGNEHPDILIMTRTLFEALEGKLVANQRFVDSRVANGGFELLKFKGCLASFDEMCPVGAGGFGSAFFLNSKYLEFVVDTETDLRTTDFVTPENQDAMVAKILLMANLVCSNCSLQGRIDFSS